jgi:hypothetical protein
MCFYWNCRNKLFASLAASVRQIVRSKELFLCTALLTNLPIWSYIHKKKMIMNKCWSEWPLLRPTHARNKESDWRGQIEHESRQNDADTSNIYPQRVPDSPQKGSYIHQTLRNKAYTSIYTRHSATRLIYCIYTRHSATRRAHTHTHTHRHIYIYIATSFIPHQTTIPILLQQLHSVTDSANVFNLYIYVWVFKTANTIFNASNNSLLRSESSVVTEMLYRVSFPSLLLNDKSLRELPNFRVFVVMEVWVPIVAVVAAMGIR